MQNYKSNNDLSALFVHDHIFISNNNNVYSDKLPYNTWKRYLKHFSSITVFSRVLNISVLNNKQSLSSGANVAFEFANNINNFRSLFGQRHSQKVKLYELIANHDVIIARLPSEYGLMAIDLAASLNKRCVVEVVGCAWDAFWNYGNWKAKIYGIIFTIRMRKAVKSSKYISYVSQEFLQKRYPANKNALTVSVSNVEIPTVDDSVLKERLKKINSNNEKLIFGLIGSLKTKYKGVHNAIPVIYELSKKHPNIELRILGDGDPSEYVEISKNLGIEDKVYFDGVLPSGDAVFNWIDSIDVYIHPSYQEGVPRSLIEAMSRGCPVIASSAGGIPELLDSGLRFNAGDEGNFLKLLDKYSFDKSWLLFNSARNHEKSKDYLKEVLDMRRNIFFDKVVSFDCK